MVFRTYIGNARFRACPMYYCTSFSRRYIGIEISMSIPMYGGPNLSDKYIGMGQYRLFPMYRLKSQEQNTSEFDNSYQSRCIKIQHTSEIQVFFKFRCIPINFPRCYLYSLAAYSRVSQLQINFPRIYPHPLAAYPRANQPHFNSRDFPALLMGWGSSSWRLRPPL